MPTILQNKNATSRFTIVAHFSTLALLAFAILRVSLLVVNWPNVSHRLLDLAYVFGIGLLYDLAFLSYAAIPFLLFLLVWPNKWANGTLFRGIAQTALYLLLFALCFNSVAEWLFWNEFGVRFNFIAVDYLIYRREVTDNILESYHVPWILTNIIFLVTSVFIFIRQSCIPAPFASETFPRRLAKVTFFLLVPATAFIMLGQGPHNLSGNNYTNELASNGPYQLFAAFRNNTLDYQKFYALGDDQVLSETLQSEVLPPTNHSKGNELYNLARHVEAPLGQNNTSM